MRDVPGDQPTPRSAGHRHRPHLRRRRANRWRPPRRRAAPRSVVTTPSSTGAGVPTTSSRPTSNATARNVPDDAVDQMSRRHVVRVAAATDENLGGTGPQIQHRDLRVVDATGGRNDREEHRLTAWQELGPQ